jgi:S1-C subfamily serine protease
VEGLDLPTAEIGDSADLKVGNIVLAVARPGEAGLSASWGAISAVGKSFRTWSGGQIDRLIRPDLIMYPGFSGGPLVDGRGRVVGVNTSGLSRSMTLTIPTETVNRVTQQLLSSGRVARGYLGLGLQQVRLPDNLVTTLGLSENRGLIVISVESGGPAESAGILVGDILIALDGRPVADTGDVQAILDPERVGQPVGARVIRGGAAQELSVTVGERPRREG